jgi:hypothetical protein
MREIFITGCDSNTEWQLSWFIRNFQKHNPNAELVFCDFGANNKPDLETIKIESDAKGWFKKPRALLDASRLPNVGKVCWIDTDCEVTANIEEIFDLSEKNMLGMVEDRPWSSRRNEYGKWYNSGVVLIEETPHILGEWARECVSNPVQGDQEVLHGMMGGDEITKLMYINRLPHTYNTLRLDFLDEIAVKNPKIIHHTGRKGNDEIRKQISEV